MVSATELFPLGVATGRAHCNRVRERNELAGSVREGMHTWLWARRRIGKTSLIEQVLHDVEPDIVATRLDLLVVHDANAFETRLRAAVEQAGSRLAPRKRSSTSKLTNAFSALKPELSFSAFGLRLKLAAPSQAGEGIVEMLLALDAAAGAYDRRVVFVLDEFQQLSELQNGAPRSLEGAVRHAVERARNVTYVFAGSRKHLLASMFEDEDRPLYRLCRKMTLERISAEDYRQFLRRVGRTRWRRRVPAEAIDCILTLTNRHPHYVNALCAPLWRAEAPPTADSAEAMWTKLVAEEGGVAAAQVARLAPSQRALLRAIAETEDGVPHPTSHSFLSQLRLPVSTGVRARDALERDDLIQQEADGRWTLVDPAMAAWLRRL
ncbi:MAG: hypothetical protein F4171_15770 [Gammaproteobacteria bacterium]|nr:hypothetical protein [Gammaproteobacteria bacterium]MDE0271037.1 hypothetical protein [Gammaproteobacteria bacterium]MYG14230.1 hypothetical protein [Gammaproteobacteria bacterium]MYK27589.1 hypothetical protein [Gammaproteobacteria bacterium]